MPKRLNGGHRDDPSFKRFSVPMSLVLDGVRDPVDVPVPPG